MKFFKLLNNISPHKTLLIVLLSLVYGVASGLFPMAVMRAVTDIMAGTRYDIYVVVLPLLVVVLVGAKRLSQQFAAYLAEAAVEDLTLRIADAVRQDQLREFEQRDHAAIYLSIVDARIITTAVTRSVEMSQQTIALLTGWLYIFSISRPVGLLFMLVYLLVLLLYEVFRAEARIQFHEISRTEGVLFGLFRHVLDGFAALKIHRLKDDDLYANYLAPCVRRIQAIRARAVIWNQDYIQCVETSFYAAFALEVFVLSAFAASELMLELLVMSLYLLKPVWVVLMALPLIAKGEVALTRLHRVIDHASERSASEALPEDVETENQWSFQELDAQDVTFTYHDHTTASGFAVGPVTLNLRRGELLLIAGGNGSGKTTLLKLLTGLYPPDSGIITLDGQPVLAEERRELFATVFAEPYLFDALYGVATVDDARLERLLQQMELTGKTAYKQERFQTLNLSHGQRKRLALIVALMEDKPICLFDEWAADQDPHFRRYFYEELLPQLQTLGKTIIAVTHDDQFYHLADRVMMMDEGRIAAMWRPQSEPERSFGQASSPHLEVALTAPHTEPAASPTADESDGHDAVAVLTWRRFDPLFTRLGWLALLMGIADVIRTYLLFAAAAHPAGWSDTRLFVGFMLGFLLLIISTHRFNVTLVQLTEQFIADLRFKILNTVRQTGLGAFETLGAERLYTALTTDMLAVSEISFSVAAIFRLCTRAVCLLGVFALLAPELFLYELLLLGSVGIVYIYNQFRIKHAIEQTHDGETELFRQITALLNGFPALRLNRRKQADFFRRSLHPACGRLTTLNLTAIRYLLINYTLMYGVFMGSIALAPLLLPIVRPTSLSVVATSLGILLSIPLQTLIEDVPRALLAAFAIRRLVALERSLTQVSPASGEVAADERALPFESLRYQDIAFQYPAQDDYPFTVGPVDFEVHSGEIVFLTGGNGSGKTTLFKLIAGLYAPDAGQVLLNRKPVDMRRHRYLFAAIFSEAHLFDRLYGLGDVNPQRVNALLEMMQLDQKVQYVNGQFTTLDLSTGQRKRLALICALLEDRPVYLFDEWAAGQDPAFRHYFYDTLLPRFKAQGKTVIAVTHDERYFHVADRVLKMEDGQMIAGGV